MDQPPQPPEVEAALRALGNVSERLDSDALEPQEGIDAGLRPEFDAVAKKMDDEVFGELQAILPHIPGPEAIDGFKSQLAAIYAELSVLERLFGDGFGADKRLQRALELAPPGDLKKELEGARHDHPGYQLLTHARWHHRRGAFAPGDALLRRVLKQDSHAAFKDVAKKALDGPRPLSGGAPSLGTMNGVGTGLYGQRDTWDDGSYITTLCICLLFVPVFPLQAYRVISEGGGRYIFYTKERLSAFARGFRWLLLASILLSIGGGMLSSYLDSPSRLASIALEEATALEAEGNAEGALLAYDDLLNRYTYDADGATIDAAASGIMRLTTAAIVEPMDASRVDRISRVVRRFGELPSGAQHSVRSGLLGQLGQWADQIGDETISDVQAGLRVIELAEEVQEDVSRELAERRARLQVSLGDRLADDWPLVAASYYVAAGPVAPGALDKAALLLGTLADNASLLREARQLIAGLVTNAVGNPTLQDRARALEEAAAAADVAGQALARVEALASREADALAAALELSPGDHDLVCAVAELRRAEGQTAEACTMIEALGSPGRLNAEAQLSLASCWMELGRLEPADELLSRIVETRMPAFQAAVQAYDVAAQALVERHGNNADRGVFPPSLQADLERASYEEQPAIYQTWLVGQLSADPNLMALRAQSQELGTVVPAAVSLGTLKLRRANSATGDERALLLADAERVFLSIREQAEGVPSFHIGLGQVYHRLGRAEEGERELAGVLAQGDLDLKMAVAGVYRELGLEPRAREVAEQVLNGAGPDDDHRAASAAILLSMMETELEDRQRWLERAPSGNVQVETSLLELRAARALREDQLEEASRLYAEAAERYHETAEHSSASANNEALAHQARYLCDGRRRHLTRAIQGMRASVRMQPDSAIAVGNLADSLFYDARIEALERHLHVTTLRASNGESMVLVDSMLRGSSRQAVLDDLRGPLAATLELSRQEQALAPHRSTGAHRELGWHRWNRDAEALTALGARLSAAGPVDSSTTDERQRRFVGGDDDATRGPATRRRVGSAERVLAAARREGHAPTVAAALVLLGSALVATETYGGGGEAARAAAAAFSEASTLWPAIGAGRSHAYALFDAAVFSLAAEHPALQVAMDRDWRSYGTSLTLHRAFAADGGDALRTAFAALPDARQAALGLRESTPEVPSLGDWLIGRLTGDSTLEELNAGALTSVRVRAAMAVGRHLAPSSLSDRAWYELLEGA